MDELEKRLKSQITFANDAMLKKVKKELGICFPDKYALIASVIGVLAGVGTIDLTIDRIFFSNTEGVHAAQIIKHSTMKLQESLELIAEEPSAQGSKNVLNYFRATVTHLDHYATKLGNDTLREDLEKLEKSWELFSQEVPGKKALPIVDDLRYSLEKIERGYTPPSKLKYGIIFLLAVICNTYAWVSGVQIYFNDTYKSEKRKHKEIKDYLNKELPLAFARMKDFTEKAEIYNAALLYLGEINDAYNTAKFVEEASHAPSEVISELKTAAIYQKKTIDDEELNRLAALVDKYANVRTVLTVIPFKK